MQKITPEFIKSILHYNPDTGILTWKVNRRPRGKKGCPAGCKTPDGYIIVGIAGEMYLAHRLIFFMETGKWPKEQIDHKDENRSNNRWKNLREATHGQNLHNHGYNKNNKAKAKGVYKRKDCARWAAMINLKGKTHYLGLFKTKKTAIRAYQSAAKKMHGNFAKF